MNNFTPRAQQVLAISRKEADLFNHNYVGTEHLLLGIVKLGQGVAVNVILKLGLSLDSIRSEVEKQVGSGPDQKMVGNIPYTPRVKKVLALAGKESKALNHSYVGTEHILLGLIREGDGVAARVLKNFELDIEKVRNQILVELDPSFEPSESENNEEIHRPPKKISTPALNAFGRDLTQMARDGKIRVAGREADVDRIVRVLARNARNNPILVGPPRIGKSSVILTLASLLVSDRWPVGFTDKRIILLDIGLLVAGTKYRGQMEERIKALLQETKKIENAILVVEDVPMVIEDELESSVLSAMRHELSSGELQCIFTAQEHEYQPAMKKLRWLEPLTHPIFIESTSREDTIKILHCKRSEYEQPHKVKITDEAVEFAAEFSELYFAPRRQPANALNLLDEAALSLRFAGDLQHPDIKEIKQHFAAIKKEKESAIKSQNFQLAATLRDTEKEASEKLSVLMKQISEAPPIVVSGSNIIDVLSERLGVEREKLEKREQLPQGFAGVEYASTFSGVPKFERLQTESVLQGQGIVIERGTGFVLMPHTDDFRNIFDLAIKPAMEANNILVKKAEDIYKPGSILAQVWEWIRKAEVVVADLTDKNPNVIFELGLCYGIQRCPILLVRNASDVPFNLRNLRYIEYENTAKGSDDLKRRLTSTVSEFLAQVRTPLESEEKDDDGFSVDSNLRKNLSRLRTEIGVRPLRKH